MITAIVSLTVYAAVAVSGTLYERQASLRQYSELSEAMLMESKDALAEMGGSDAAKLAAKRAELADEKLMAWQSDVEMLADTAGDIVNNPQYYIHRPLDQDAAWLWRSENASPSLFAQEAGLMGNMQSLLSAIKNNTTDATTAYVGSELGYFITTSRKPKENELFDSRERPWYLAAKNAGSTVWTDVYEDARGRGLTITCSAPFYKKNGVLAGVAGIDAFLNELEFIMSEGRLWESEMSFVVNEHCDILIASKEPGPAIQSSIQTLINESKNEDAVSFQIDDDGEMKDYLVAHSRIGTLPWDVVILIDFDEIYEPAVAMQRDIGNLAENTVNSVNNAILTLIMLFAVVLVVIVAAIWFISRKFTFTITKPITELQKSVGVIASGDLEHSIAIETRDEIEDLGHSINKMTADLKEYIINLEAVTAEKRRISTELNVATRIQSGMLPCIFPAYPSREEFDIFACMFPAEEVGGDFYDFFLMDEDRLAVVVADVSDKGVPAALFMVIAKTLIKNNAQSGKSPKEAFEAVNNVLCENNDSEMFVTAFMGYLEISTGKFTYVNAGHNPPLIKHGDGKYEFLPVHPGFVLAGMNDMRYQDEALTMGCGDMIYLYTDGVTEAVSSGDEYFESKRLLKTVNQCLSETPNELITRIKAEVDIFANGAKQADDITMLALQIKNKPAKELVISAEIEKLPDVLDFIEPSLDGFDDKSKTQVNLVVEEIFVNIANYAYAPGIGSVTIRIKRKLDELVIEFEDSGLPYNPLLEQNPDTELSLEERPIGGLGVFLVKSFVDDLTYDHRDGRNVLTVRKFRMVVRQK